MIPRTPILLALGAVAAVYASLLPPGDLGAVDAPSRYREARHVLEQDPVLQEALTAPDPAALDPRLLETALAGTGLQPAEFLALHRQALATGALRVP